MLMASQILNASRVHAHGMTLYLYPELAINFLNLFFEVFVSWFCDNPRGRLFHKLEVGAYVKSKVSFRCSRIFCFSATKPKAIIFHLRGKETSVKSRGAQSATIRKAVEPRTPFQYPFVIAVLCMCDGIAWVW